MDVPPRASCDVNMRSRALFSFVPHGGGDGTGGSVARRHLQPVQAAGGLPGHQARVAEDCGHGGERRIGDDQNPRLSIRLGWIPEPYRVACRPASGMAMDPRPCGSTAKALMLP